MELAQLPIGNNIPAEVEVQGYTVSAISLTFLPRICQTKHDKVTVLGKKICYLIFLCQIHLLLSFQVAWLTPLFHWTEVARILWKITRAYKRKCMNLTAFLVIVIQWGPIGGNPWMVKLVAWCLIGNTPLCYSLFSNAYIWHQTTISDLMWELVFKFSRLVYCSLNIMFRNSLSLNGILIVCQSTSLEWGVLKVWLIDSLPWMFIILQKHMVFPFNHIHNWQVSPQLSCGDTCQIWMWYATGKYFSATWNIEKLTNSRNWFN